MAGEFRGVEVTAGYCSVSAGQPFPVQMPADIVAGDILVVSGGAYNLAVYDHAVSPVPPATGWFAVDGPRQIFVKIADGSEAGALSTEFTTLDTSGLGAGSRAYVVAAFSYRFPVAPLTNGTAGPNNYCHPFTRRLFTDTPPADSSAHGGTYPGSVNSASQFRFFDVTAQAYDGVNTAPADDATWSGDLMTDRTGLHSQAWSGAGLVDDVSWSWADAFYLTNVANADPHTKVVIDAPYDVGVQLCGFSLFFAAVPTSAYWGIDAVLM